MSEKTSPTIQQQIDDDLKKAMRERDEIAKLALRSLKAAISEASKVGDQHTLDDDAILVIAQKEAKQRRDAAAEYDQASRPEQAAQERAELAVLERYLPQQLGESEIEAIVSQVIVETGATSMNDMGKVMSATMPRVAGVADGKAVNQIVRRLLSGQ
jgi:uncharacterized protein YqeY